MNRMLRFIFLTAILSVSASSNAGGQATQNGTIEFLKIESNLVTIKIQAEDQADPDDCGTVGSVMLSDDTTNGDRQYSALIAAQMAQKPIKLYVSGCIEKSGISYPKLWAVFLLN